MTEIDLGDSEKIEFDKKISKTQTLVGALVTLVGLGFGLGVVAGSALIGFRLVVGNPIALPILLVCAGLVLAVVAKKTRRSSPQTVVCPEDSTGENG